ncbi:recombinase family protein [Nocardia sp. R6R-6]|uniref:recombinase family protein n=1 Tax=Nocardia sp. R6R-6 TaxID=3459303 RepID=UPI00403DDF36
MSTCRGCRYACGSCESATGESRPRSAPRSTTRRVDRAAGCEKIFVDKASGKLATRPELDKALLSADHAGDQLVVTELDRLGRSLEHLIELPKTLESRSVELVVLDQNIDTSTTLGRNPNSNCGRCSWRGRCTTRPANAATASPRSQPSPASPAPPATGHLGKNP